MRRLLALTSVAVLTLTLAVPAGAAKPPKDPPGQEPLEGLKCLEWEFDDPTLWTVGSIGSGVSEFLVKLTAANPAACFDVSSGEGEWVVDIVAVEAAGLQVQIKDSVPGDFCFREGYGGRKNPIPEQIVVSVPAADRFDACTPEGEVGLAADQAQELVFMVALSPEKRASSPPSVTVSVDLP